MIFNCIPYFLNEFAKPLLRWIFFYISYTLLVGVSLLCVPLVQVFFQMIPHNIYTTSECLPFEDSFLWLYVDFVGNSFSKSLLMMSLAEIIVLNWWLLFEDIEDTNLPRMQMKFMNYKWANYRKLDTFYFLCLLCTWPTTAVLLRKYM